MSPLRTPVAAAPAAGAEIELKLALPAGGGAALLREKLVWEASKRCVVIADAAKHVKVLGKFPLPIEVVRLRVRRAGIWLI